MKSLLIKLLALITLTISLTGCQAAVKRYTQAMLDERPLTVLILPPINESTAADAPLYFSTTIYEPLVLNGFYVFPYDITSSILFFSGFIDSSELENTSLESFKSYFGADAVLFTKIKKWNLSYMVFSSSLTVEIDYKLVSTDSERVLWESSKDVVINLSSNTSSGGLGGLIVSAVSTGINTLSADYTTYARNLNFEVFLSLPAGKYHKDYLKDVPTDLK